MFVRRKHTVADTFPELTCMTPKVITINIYNRQLTPVYGLLDKQTVQSELKHVFYHIHKYYGVTGLK
jgi:hypothetical protein